MAAHRSKFARHSSQHFQSTKTTPFKVFLVVLTRLGIFRTTDRVSDPVIINTMFSVAKTVHDSINALTFADEVRHINKLIVAFINKVWDPYIYYAVSC